MNILDPCKMPLDGVNLIEASAGTGKTYTITSLYLRLVLEQELIPDRILVVTFTDSATRELRERIRVRLVEALAYLQTGETDNEFIRDYFSIRFQGEKERKRAKVLLLRVVDRLDLAAIFTIHGFCQRVLHEHAFNSGALFQEELDNDESARLRRIVDDYWRLHIGTWSESIIAYLHQQNSNPDTLFAEFSPLVAHVNRGGKSAVLSPDVIDPADFDGDKLINLIETAWQQERGIIVDLVMESKALSRSKGNYRLDLLQTMIGNIDDFVYHDGVIPLKSFEFFAASRLEQGTKKSKMGETPCHSFFDLCERLVACLKGVFCFIRRDLLLYCAEQLPRMKRKQQVFTFDDLLLGVRDGLSKPGKGEEFATLIRRQFPVALIDEFQDTDPIQFSIFNTIYGARGSTMIMIGDPKQAIYSFRGADIFAYLKAAKNVDYKRRFTLDVNFRAATNLVDAVNFLFGGCNPFLLTEIGFHSARGRENVEDHFVLDKENGEGLALVEFESNNNKRETQKNIASDLAIEVENLLVKASRGRAEFCAGNGSRPLNARDIAVLVRTHEEGNIVGAALAARNLKYLSCSPLSVYATLEARELAVILKAVHDPFNEGKVRAAFATRLLMASAFDEAVFPEERWMDMVAVFSRCRRIWMRQGVSVMMAELFSRFNASSHQARFHDGERVLTNVRHLLELLHQATHGQSLGPAALIKWLTGQIEERKKTEEGQLRLESDENLIRVITIHKSKGLEFPVVFCPFLWTPVPRLQDKKKPFVFHDADGALKVDLGSAGAGKNRHQYNQEQLAEGLRLAYVALTRASYRCYLWQGSCKLRSNDDINFSPLNYLMKSLHQPLLQPENESAISTGIFSVAIPPEPAGIFAGSSERICDHRPLPERIRPGWVVQSFSALHHHSAKGRAEAGASPWQRQATSNATALNRFTFPRGTAAGSCLHLIFEHLDFSRASDEDLQLLTASSLKQFAFADKWVPAVSQMIRDVLQTGLDPQLPGLTLSAISRDQRLDEMEFYFTIPQLSTDELQRIFARAMMKDGTAGTSLPRQGIDHGSGFIKGFVDLLFHYQGRYYLVDYKSNHLGDCADDYGLEKLDLVMAEAQYDLQYYIYLVALHRFLNHRLADYDYDRHFGGVYYLFIRGMSPGSNSGIFRDRPGYEVVHRLDQQLGGDGEG